jgi:hypothetical protein
MMGDQARDVPGSGDASILLVKVVCQMLKKGLL